MGRPRKHWQEPKKAMRRGAASLANLRPVSADPEALKKLPSLFGSPTATHKLCGAPCKGTQAPERRGQPCRQIASFGTDRCIKHGARALAKIAPTPRKLAIKAAYKILADNPIPLELTRQEAWRRNEQEPKLIGDRQIRRAALVQAWLEGTQKGQWKQWQTTSNH
jgi:hypothetical protein